MDGEGPAAHDVDDVAVAEGDAADRIDPQFEADLEALAAGSFHKTQLRMVDVPHHVTLDPRDIMSAERLGVDHFLERDAFTPGG